MKTLLARARARGVRIYGGTMLPRRRRQEAVRQHRCRPGKAAGRQCVDPDRRHPNDAGYAAMAAAVDPRLFGG
jgi:hypothetical protein